MKDLSYFYCGSKKYKKTNNIYTCIFKRNDILLGKCSKCNAVKNSYSKIVIQKYISFNSLFVYRKIVLIKKMFYQLQVYNIGDTSLISRE